MKISSFNKITITAQTSLCLQVVCVKKWDFAVSLKLSAQASTTFYSRTTTESCFTWVWLYIYIRLHQCYNMFIHESSLYRLYQTKSCKNQLFPDQDG